MNLIIIPDEGYNRQVYLGGSDIAGVLGLQPRSWRTSVQIFQRKTAAPEEQEPESPKAKRKLLARGQIVEPLVAQMLEVLHGITGTVKGHRYKDADIPAFAAEIDMEVPFGAVRHLFSIEQGMGVSDDEIVNIEIKTVHPFAADEWGEEGSEEVPIHYAAQIYWGLGVTKRRFAICAALFGADDLVLYPIVRDDATIVGMRQKAWKFWEGVMSGTAPAPTNIADTLRLWPQDDGHEVEATEEMVAAVQTLAALTASRKSYEGGEEGVGLLIREYMKDKSALVVDWVEIATLKAQNTQSIDSGKLKAEFPEAFKACRRVGQTRVLRLKEKAL